MQGRIENKINLEDKISNLIARLPDESKKYVERYYYTLDRKQHTTKIRYIENVIRFLRYYGKGDDVNIDSLNNIDSFEINKYISNINFINNGNHIKEMSPESVALILSSLNSFFTFMCANNYIKDNPFANKRIEWPKIKEREITFLTPEEVRNIEKTILNGTGTSRAVERQEKWKYRDLLLFRIPVINGIRVRALSEINISDLNMDDKSVSVTEKGNIDKKVYLDETTINYLNIWLKQREHLMSEYGNDTGCQALFISNIRQRMSYGAINYTIKKYAENATNKHITPHKLRSTCATNLYSKTRDIYLVSKVLGHKTTVPTSRYTKVFDTDKRDAVNILADIYS